LSASVDLFNLGVRSTWAYEGLSGEAYAITECGRRRDQLADGERKTNFYAHSGSHCCRPHRPLEQHRQGIEFAARLSPVTVLHVEPIEHSPLLQADWERYVEQPFRAAGKEPPKLQVLPSPYRFVIIPIVQFILDLSKEHPTRSIVVVIPELVEDKWYEYFLHNQRGRLLEWVLLARGNERIFTVSAPWYVGERT
jgi:hypothetical protein